MATEHLKNDRYFPAFCKLSYIVKIFWANIFQGKKYGVVQTISPISRDFLFLGIKLNCSHRFPLKTDISKIAFVSQNVQSFEKNSPKETRENPLLTLLFLAMLTS